MATPIVNYVRARLAFMPLGLKHDQAEAGDEGKVALWLKLLPQGERELTAPPATGDTIALQPTFRPLFGGVAKGWNGMPTTEAALTLKIGRHYQLGGTFTTGGAVLPLPTAIVKIKEI